LLFRYTVKHTQLYKRWKCTTQTERLGPICIHRDSFVMSFYLNFSPSLRWIFGLFHLHSLHFLVNKSKLTFQNVTCLGCCIMWNRSNDHNANRKHTCNSDPLDLHNPMTVLTFNMSQLKPVSYGTYQYPLWAILIGWIIGMASVVPILIHFLSDFIFHSNNTFLHFKLRWKCKAQEL
jgi:hypothetical protein